MPDPDLVGIIASLPLFAFVPAAEVPVAPDRWHFIAPSIEHEGGGWPSMLAS
jgi:hypothetical protein